MHPTIGISFVHFHRRETRRSLSTFDRKEIAHLAFNNTRDLKNRRRIRRGWRSFDALKSTIDTQIHKKKGKSYQPWRSEDQPNWLPQWW